jgi:sulfonate transport system permease protein
MDNALPNPLLAVQKGRTEQASATARTASSQGNTSMSVMDITLRDRLTPKARSLRIRVAPVLLVFGFYAGLLGLWQLVYELQIWSPFLLPQPSSVFNSIQRYIDNGVLFDSIQITMQRMLIGFGIAFAVGMTMGIATGSVRWIDQTIGSLVLGMQSLPSICWLPLAILWFGLSEKAIIFVVVLGSVWAVAISARDGVRSIPVLQRRAAQVFGASRWQTIRYVTLPGMLPSMAQGLKLGWSFSWRSLMAGEIIFVTAGLGHLLQLGRDLNNMSLVLAIMGVIVAVGLLFDRLVFGPLDNWVQNRWGLSNN